jgi:hypothetical protein
MKRLFFTISLMAVMSGGSHVIAQTNYITHVLQPDTVQTPSICMVSVTPDNKNVVLWDKLVNLFTDSFRIYRESAIQSGQWDLIGVQEYSAYSVFTDSTVNPSKQSYRYKIASIDKCGNKTSLSPEHKTINLLVAKGANSSWSLSWDQYVGFNVFYYRIYRGSSPDSLQMIDSTASGNLNYNDFTISQSEVYYQVEVLNPAFCNPSNKKSNLSYNSSRSNIVAANLANGIAILKQKPGLFIYPNPFADKTTLLFPNPGHQSYEIIIYDLTGKSIYSKSTTSDKVEITKGSYRNGVYILEVNGPERYRSKLVINE